MLRREENEPAKRGRFHMWVGGKVPPKLTLSPTRGESSLLEAKGWREEQDPVRVRGRAGWRVWPTFGGLTLLCNHTGNSAEGGRKDGENPCHVKFCKKRHWIHFGAVMQHLGRALQSTVLLLDKGGTAESVKEVPWNGLSLHIPCHTPARLQGPARGEMRPCSGLKGAGFGNKQSWRWDSCECCQDTDNEFGS